MTTGEENYEYKSVCVYLDLYIFVWNAMQNERGLFRTFGDYLGYINKIIPQINFSVFLGLRVQFIGKFIHPIVGGFRFRMGALRHWNSCSIVG